MGWSGQKAQRQSGDSLQKPQGSDEDSGPYTDLQFLARVDSWPTVRGYPLYPQVSQAQSPLPLGLGSPP